MQPALDRHRLAFWSILVLGALVRLVFALEVTAKDVDMESAAPRDMWLYAEEARLVVRGDPLLRGVPELLAPHVSEGLGAATFLVSAEGREHFHRLYGREPLINAPLYPHLLALSLRCTGGFGPARLLQIALGLLVAVGTWLLARAVGAGERAALIAMALIAFHPTTALYGAFLLRTSLITALLLGFCLTLAWQASRPGWRPDLAVGASLGLMHLTMEMVPFMLPFALLGALRGPGGWPGRLRRAGLAGVGFALVVSPLVARNLACGTGLLHNGSQSHLGILQYNFVGADGLHLVRPEASWIKTVVRPDDSNLTTLRKAIGTHPSPAHWLLLLGRKLHGVWNGYEPPNNVNPHLLRGWIRSLGLFPAGSTLLIALAIPGVGLLLRRAGATWPVLAGMAIVVAMCLAAVALARYRLPIAPYMAIAAGLTGEALARALSRRRWRWRVALAVGLVVSTGVAWPRGRTRYSPLETSLELGVQYERIGKLGVAREHALRARQELPWRSPAQLLELTLPELVREREVLSWILGLLHKAGDEASVRRLAAREAASLAAAADALAAPEAGQPDAARRGLVLTAWAAESSRLAGDLDQAERLYLRLQGWTPDSGAIRERLEEVRAAREAGR